MFWEEVILSVTTPVVPEGDFLNAYLRFSSIGLIVEAGASGGPLPLCDFATALDDSC